NARFKELPSGYRPLDPAEVKQVNEDQAAAPAMPAQEPGIRDSCALPYELLVSGGLDKERQVFAIQFRAGNTAFGRNASGAPFHVYAPGNYLQAGASPSKPLYGPCRSWAYAVAAGDTLPDAWPLSHFEGGDYKLEVYGPNGFFRSFKGNKNDPLLSIRDAYELPSSGAGAPADKLLLKILNNHASQRIRVHLADRAYGIQGQEREIPPGREVLLAIETGESHGWYDFTVRAEGYEAFAQRFAGRVETGLLRKSDPVMGNFNL
ncbi:MAG TPA: phospholipase domain-containing protein, partial [Anseongella sp.]|nr:phospholipase domain-containing protein [Anseongella sp.]